MKRFFKDAEKRNQFILVVLGTLVVLAVIYFGLIRPQYASLSRIATDKRDADTKLQQVKEAIKKSDDTAAELTDVSDRLRRAEEDVASGDLYAWMYDTIRQFKQPYHVDIPFLSQPVVSDVDVLPQFPYKQLRVSVNGTAYYHDLGKFIADFENNLPHIRLVNLTLEPAGGADSEKLNFRMDIVALVKPNS
jgi:Tfp pilus assembly protein PilO